MVRFAGGIEYGGDKAQFMYELGKGLPLSILVFTISMVGRVLIYGLHESKYNQVRSANFK